jgi:hypothetical protein
MAPKNLSIRMFNFCPGKIFVGPARGGGAFREGKMILILPIFQLKQRSAVNLQPHISAQKGGDKRLRVMQITAKG